MSISEARKAVAQSLGISGVDGSPASFEALSDLDAERLTIGLNQFVVQNPEQFTSEQVSVAKLALQKVNFGTLGDYRTPGLLDNAGEFLHAYAETAGEVAKGAGEVAGDTVKAIGINPVYLLSVVGLLAVAWIASPLILKGFARPK